VKKTNVDRLQFAHRYETYCATPHMGHPHHANPKWPCHDKATRFTAPPQIPPSLDHRGLLRLPRDQGAQGACFAFAACAMREWQQTREARQKSNVVAKVEYYSPQFLYNHRFNFSNLDPSDDEGMEGMDMMHLLKEVGVVPETSYPYGKVEHPKDIRSSLIRMAAKAVIAGYAYIDTQEGLKMALVNNGPCIICFPVYSPDQLALWKPQGPSSPMLGGHAMLVVGYNTKGYIIRNSWGVNWGGAGHTLYPYADWGSHWEIWTTLDAKDTP
jgi:C1A family cysteine protease